MDWLQKFNPITFDFQARTITINKEGQHVLLLGMDTSGSLQKISCKRLQKLLNAQQPQPHGYLCDIKTSTDTNVTSANAAYVMSDIQYSKLQILLTQYEDVFAEPTGLPPARRHNHRNPLLAGSQPVNQRGYRVPYVQKTEIERQIKEHCRLDSFKTARARLLLP